MIRIDFNAQTGEKTIVEVPDIEVPTAEILDPDAELAAAINAATTIPQLKAALLGDGGVAKVKGRMK